MSQPPQQQPQQPQRPSPGSIRVARVYPIPVAPKGAPKQTVRDDRPFTLPTRSHPTDAGLDLVASIDAIIPPGSLSRIAHNFAIEVPQGFFAMIVPRSATLLNKHLLVVTGTIDPGYRGEVQTVVWNVGRMGSRVQAGERLSQLLILPLIQLPIMEVPIADLSQSERGEGGFGSTGGFVGR